MFVPSVVVPLLRIDEKQQSGSSSGRSRFSKVLSRLFKVFQAEDAKTRCFLLASLLFDCVWTEATCAMARLYVCDSLDSVFSCKLSFFLFFFPDNYVSPTPPPVCLMLSRIFNKKVTFLGSLIGVQRVIWKGGGLQHTPLPSKRIKAIFQEVSHLSLSVSLDSWCFSTFRG